MRIVSMVPSWTETLVEAGIDVVGRTRFCIHPGERVAAIPRVGGTKDWKLDLVRDLDADFILLDKEENPKSMAEHAPAPLLVTHVESVRDVARELKQLGQKLATSKLVAMSEEWKGLLGGSVTVSDADVCAAGRSGPRSVEWFESFPGVIEWGVRPWVPVKRVIYVIWKNPWMAVAQNTFIGSVLELCGLSGMLFEFSDQPAVKYPQIDLLGLSDSSTLILFSSEPYPFLRKKSELPALRGPYAFVDGESFSWFGVRSLRFLQAALGG